MKILLASDSFKESFSSLEINRLLKQFFESLDPDVDGICCPVTDGGEGTIEILHYHGLGDIRKVNALDPLFRPLKTIYLWDPATDTAYIEMAKASGLELLEKQEQNCFLTSSYGTGLIIRDAIESGARKILLFIGGSATNDCGIGMAEALGCKFFDGKKELKRVKGKDMANVTRINCDLMSPQFENVDVEVLCDVRNPLTGPHGAAYTYGPQKGATTDEIEWLEKGAGQLSQIMDIDPRVEGSGAAGGMGYGARAFLGAKISGGAKYIFRLIGMKDKIKNCDLIITGEGKYDEQTTHGKLISEIFEAAGKQNKKCIVLAAVSDLNSRREQVDTIPVYVLYPSPPDVINRSDTVLRLKEASAKILADQKIRK